MTWLVRGAVTDITPNSPVELGGFALRRGTHSAVHDRIEANAILLECNGSAALFVAFDLLYVPRGLGDAIRRSAAATLGLDPASVVVAASHTHHAPMVDATKPNLGVVDVAYAAWLEARSEQLVAAVAAQTPQPAILHARVHRSRTMVARRARVWRLRQGRVWRGYDTYPNPRTWIDDRVITLTWQGRDGRTCATIWHAACHPTAFYRADAVSGDYPGALRATMRAAEGAPELPVVFVQGFSGDVRPQLLRRPQWPGLRRQAWIDAAEALLNRGPAFAAPEAAQYEAWLARWRDEITNAPVQQILPTAGTIYTAMRQQPLARLLTQVPSAHTLRFQAVGLGPDVVFVGGGAEFVAAYAHALLAMESSRLVIPMGCLDDCFGYVPTDAMCREGGYEGGGFLPAFSWTGRFNDGIEAVVRQELAAAMAATRPDADPLRGP